MLGCLRNRMPPRTATARQAKEDMVIRAVMFDFGGVISSSPFEAFAQLETERGLPPDFIRTVNATNPDVNAWAQLERSEVDIDTFVDLWSAEALVLGYEVDAREVLSRLAGHIRPQMVQAIGTCRGAGLTTACLTNNFSAAEGAHSPEALAVYELFDVVLESRVLGVRKPDPRFYELACEAAGVTPVEAVFLDDLGVNLKPARAMGMHTIKVTDPDQALTELEALLGLSLG
jgi:putative hydrolase of the HAD superfamily